MLSVCLFSCHLPPRLFNFVLSVSLSVCLLSSCLPVCLLVGLSVCLFVCLSVICLLFFLISFCLYAWLSLHVQTGIAFAPVSDLPFRTFSLFAFLHRHWSIGGASFGVQFQRETLVNLLFALESPCFPSLAASRGTGAPIARLPHGRTSARIARNRFHFQSRDILRKKKRHFLLILLVEGGDASYRGQMQNVKKFWKLMTGGYFGWGIDLDHGHI